MLKRYKPRTYDGVGIYAPLDLNLYGREDNIHYKETTEALLRGFTDEFEIEVKSALWKAGLKFEGFKWYSPKAYNFAGDSVDFKINMASPKRYREYVEAHADRIDEALKDNKSYDGYMARTVPSVRWELDEELAVKGMDHEADIIVIRDILSDIDWKGFDEYDYFETCVLGEMVASFIGKNGEHVNEIDTCWNECPNIEYANDDWKCDKCEVLRPRYEVEGVKLCEKHYDLRMALVPMGV